MWSFGYSSFFMKNLWEYALRIENTFHNSLLKGKILFFSHDYRRNFLGANFNSWTQLEVMFTFLKVHFYWCSQVYSVTYIDSVFTFNFCKCIWKNTLSECIYFSTKGWTSEVDDVAKCTTRTFFSWKMADISEADWAA